MKPDKEREKKMVAKYAEKRTALKAAGDYAALDLLPKNLLPVRLKNQLPVNWSA